MQEVFGPPETERETETEIGTSIRKDAGFEQDSCSSYRLWGSMKFEEDGHLLSQAKRDLSLIGGSMKFEEDGHLPSQAKRDLSHLDYQACSAESNYVTELGSHAYSKDLLSLGREYHSQKPTSICSWEKSTALEAASSRPLALGNTFGTMRAKTNTLSARPDYRASYPSTAPDMRKYPRASELDYSLDHSEHRYGRSGRFTAFPSHKGQSIEHFNEMTKYARGSHYADETNYISRQWRFNGGPSYGDEIPSLSRKKYYEAPSRSGQGHYGPQTPLFSRRHGYGDEIPSLLPNWRCRDKIPSHSSHWCHDAEACIPPRHQQGASNGNAHLRKNFARIDTNEQAKIITGKHTFSKHRMFNGAVNSGHHHRINVKDNQRRNSEDISDQVRGPRANKLNNVSVSSTAKDIMSPLIHRDQFNRPKFLVQYKQAKFFMIKSFSEDDIHKGIKYNVWASTPHGNNKLDAAYREAQILMKENGEKCPVFLFFSVNTSGQFVGLAEMLGPVDFKKTMDFWKEDIWSGFFPIIWHIIKDIRNILFKHIILENNNNRIVTFSRDTQEIGLPQGLQMLKIFKDHPHGASILDDFDFYEEKDNARRVKKRGKESAHEAQFSDDLKSMENLEARVESFSLYENWQC